MLHSGPISTCNPRDLQPSGNIIWEHSPNSWPVRVLKQGEIQTILGPSALHLLGTLNFPNSISTCDSKDQQPSGRSRDKNHQELSAPKCTPFPRPQVHLQTQGPESYRVTYIPRGLLPPRKTRELLPSKTSSSTYNIRGLLSSGTTRPPHTKDKHIDS